ncbi:MAG TPA: hypothetical protein VFG10_03010 [Saprospiraceae bacterium]|nr:hypothetical protein [Saprospiraceae bacterium]
MIYQLRLYVVAMLGILIISCNEGSGKILQYDLDREENSFVVIQLKEQIRSQEAESKEKDIKDVVDQIKIINAKLGFTDFEKKLASLDLDSKEGTTPYIVVRNFEDLKSAEAYASAIEKEIQDNIYGEIGHPFPISQSNYKSCIADKDFKSYFNFYRKTRR